MGRTLNLFFAAGLTHHSFVQHPRSGHPSFLHLTFYPPCYTFPMDNSFPRIQPLGDSAVQVALGETIDLALNRRVQALAFRLEGGQGRMPSAPADRQSAPARPDGVGEVVPAYASLVVHFDLMRIDYDAVVGWIRAQLEGLDERSLPAPRRVEIPVLYGGAYGPDLDFVARHNGLTPAEVVAIHSAGEYPVYMLGFMPGFPYLGGLDARITAPRLESPRSRVPAGSVGIAGSQTGIYPLDSPGGWRLIGWTPLRLFDPAADPPALLTRGMW